jgi:peroxiredoxin
MKNHFVIYSLALATLGMYSCKDNSAFKVEGTIKNAEKSTKVFLLRADSNQVSKIDSVEIIDGKFAFKNQAPSVNLFKLQIGRDANGAIFDFIAQNGEAITFETDMKDAAHQYKISGSNESERLQEFVKISNTYGEKNAKLVNEFQLKSQSTKNQDSLLKVYQPGFIKNIEEGSKETLKFINDNKKTLAAFYAAQTLEPFKYETQLVAYADDIKDEFKDNVTVQRFKQQMELAKPLSVGHKAPEFATTGMDGKPVKLSDYKGKYVMLDFWASWCVPCRQENPNVVKLYNQYKSKGLNILGISLDEDKSAWNLAIQADKLTWQHASDLKKFDGPTEKLYHIEAIPSNFIIDPQGNIIAKNVTGKDLEDFLNTTFAKL